MTTKSNYEVKELNKEILKENHKGLFETLENLSEVGKISAEKAVEVLDKINSQGSHIFIVQKDDGEIIGTGTLLIEQKFIHSGGKVGHVEDVATRVGYEGKGIGSAVMKAIIEFAKKAGCYKIILDCSNKNVPYYERFGFHKHENCMRLDL